MLGARAVRPMKLFLLRAVFSSQVFCLTSARVHAINYKKAYVAYLDDVT